MQDSYKTNAFEKVSRHETRLQGNLYRALHELERLQAARRGNDVDAEVSGSVS